MVEEAKPPAIELRVAKAMPEDAEKGIVRMDSRATKTLDVAVGDIVEIEGKKVTAAIVERAYPSDVGVSIARMDGFIRKNADTSIGEGVKVRKADVKEAKKITLAPAQAGIQVQIMGGGLEGMLRGRPFVKGDIISPTQRRRGRYRRTRLQLRPSPTIPKDGQRNGSWERREH